MASGPGAKPPDNEDRLRILQSILEKNPSAELALLTKAVKNEELVVKGYTFTPEEFKSAAMMHRMKSLQAAASSSSSSAAAPVAPIPIADIGILDPAVEASGSKANDDIDMGGGDTDIDPENEGGDVAVLEPVPPVGLATYDVVPADDMTHLAFDHYDSSWVVVNSRTHSKQQLPNPREEWQLEFANGEAFVFDIADPTHLLPVDQMFAEKVCTRSGSAPDADLFVVRVADAGPVSHTPLHDYLNTHRCGTVEIKCATGTRSSTLTLVKFDVPRDGCRFFWSAYSLFEACEVHRPASRLSTTLNKRLIPWGKVLAKKQIDVPMRSMPVMKPDETPTFADKLRILKFHSLSTTAFLTVLMQLAEKTRFQGGFERYIERVLAKHLLHFLVNLVVHIDMPFLVLFNEGSGHRSIDTYIASGASSFHVPIGKDGRLDLTSMRDLATRPGPSNSKLWIKYIVPHTAGYRPTIMEFVKYSLSRQDKCFHDLNCQLCWGLGHLLDSNIDKIAAAGFNDKLVFRVDDNFDGFADDVYICKYMEGINNEMQRRPLLMISAAPDKSRVQSIGMFCCPYVLPNGKAFWGPPQECMCDNP